MNAIEHEQGSQGWRDSRAGKITASRIADIFASPRKGQKESVTRRNYAAQLICERLSGKATREEDQYQSWDMRRGTELEPIARAEYEIKTNSIVDTAGFVEHPTIKNFGCSVDGKVGKVGLVQYKCVKTAIHLDWLLKGVVPVEHRPQIWAELSCYPEREWEDFCSYEPNLPAHLQLFIMRLKRDPVEISEIEAGVLKFNADIEEIIAKLPKENQSEDLTEVLTESLKAAKK